MIARLLLGLAGLVALAAAAPVDWTRTTRLTPKGAFVVGNPAAPFKLVEYGSYTCPHCAAFAKESEPVLRGRLIRGGKVSLEYRHLIRDPADLGAAILARCTGTAGFARASAAIFAAQPTWFPKAAAWGQAHPEATGWTDAKRARGYADGSGLTAMIQAQGLSPQRIAACFADRAGIDRITAMTGDAPIEVASTPTFYLNGQLQPPVGWDGLQQILRAQGAL